jgi:hypothetical protein
MKEPLEGALNLQTRPDPSFPFAFSIFAVLPLMGAPCPFYFLFSTLLIINLFYDKKERIINFIINPQAKEESMRKTYQPCP